MFDGQEVESVEVLSMAMVLRENIAGLPPGSEHISVGKWFLGQSLPSRFATELKSAHRSIPNKNAPVPGNTKALTVSQNC